MLATESAGYLQELSPGPVGSQEFNTHLRRQVKRDVCSSCSEATGSEAEGGGTNTSGAGYLTRS